MWRLCKLGYRHEPRLMLAAFALSQLAALPDALIALWLMLLGKGVLEGRPRLVLASALGLGISATATWFLRTVSTRVQRRFRDRVTIALESHVARLQASVATIAHHERPDYLDRLAMLRNQVFVLDHMYMSVFADVRLDPAARRHRRAARCRFMPALGLLAVFALPTVLDVDVAAGGRARGAGARAQPIVSPGISSRPRRPRRRAKRCACTGIGERLVVERRAAWERGYREIAPARWSSAAWHTLAWAVFGGGLRRGDRLCRLRPRSATRRRVARARRRFAVVRLHRRHRRRDWLPSRFLDVRVATFGLARGLRGVASPSRTRIVAVPSSLQRGIRLDHVSFCVSGDLEAGRATTCRLALPAGAVVAIVGENGAGKTTLVKLLAKM